MGRPRKFSDEERKARAKAAKKIWLAAHPEYVREQRRKWRENWLARNPDYHLKPKKPEVAERKRKRDAEYRVKHIDAALAYGKEYYAKNRLKFKEYAVENRSSINTKRKARDAKQRGRIRERARNYGKKNRPQITLKQRQWRKANAAHIRAWEKTYATAYYSAHGDSIRARAAKWRLENPEKAAETKRIYKARFPERLRARSQKYKARKKGAKTGNQKTIIAWDRAWRGRSRVKCYWCLETFPPVECHTDHIVALEKGGAHSIENLCISCGTCNTRKQHKTLEQWNAHLEQPALL